MCGVVRCGSGCDVMGIGGCDVMCGFVWEGVEVALSLGKGIADIGRDEVWMCGKIHVWRCGVVWCGHTCKHRCT